MTLTTSVMRKLHAYFGSQLSDPDVLMIRAAACVCFFGFLRAGELTVSSDKAFSTSMFLGRDSREYLQPTGGEITPKKVKNR